VISSIVTVILFLNLQARLNIGMHGVRTSGRNKNMSHSCAAHTPLSLVRQACQLFLASILAKKWFLVASTQRVLVMRPHRTET
jgi:hypothetical protein